MTSLTGQIALVTGASRGIDTTGFGEAFDSTGHAANPRLMLPRTIAEIARAADASSTTSGSAIDAFGSSNPLFS
jgi:hypothetical protein